MPAEDTEAGMVMNKNCQPSLIEEILYLIATAVSGAFLIAGALAFLMVVVSSGLGNINWSFAIPHMLISTLAFVYFGFVLLYGFQAQDDS